MCFGTDTENSNSDKTQKEIIVALKICIEKLEHQKYKMDDQQLALSIIRHQQLEQDSLQRHIKSSLVDELKRGLFSFNLYPSKTASDYLERANCFGTAQQAMQNDWQKVCDSMWVSWAKIISKKDFGESHGRG